MKLKKAMLFAAGFGTRLKPLTDKKPKPLLPIGNHPMLAYILNYLKQNGVEEVVINLHHLGDQIKTYLKQQFHFGLKIHFSEEKVILGTAGGLKQVQSHFENEDLFLTMNSDLFIDCDLQTLERHHSKENKPATMVCLPWMEGYTRIDNDKLYSGLSLLTPAIFDVITLEDRNLVTEGIVRLKAHGIYLHRGYWRDIGTLENYQAIQEEWASGHHQRPF